jgi:hypothetical protein
MLTVAVLATMSAQVPQWYSTHSHPKYPAGAYIIGVGSGSGAAGAEAAKKGALADIVSQLRVQVQSEMKSVTESFAVNDDEQIYSDFKRQSRTMVSDEITGADVVETVTDEGTASAYALVVLDRDKYSAGLRSELESGWKQASDLRTAAADFFAKGKVTEAVQSINQIKQVIAPLFAKQVLHNAAARAPFSFPSVFNPAALQSDIRSFLSQIKLEKKGGDGQKGKIGEKLTQPLMVVVTANGVPCSGLSISFLLEGKTLLGEELTDDKGTALFATIIRSGSGVKAKLNVAGLGREFEQNLNASSVNFTWSAQASDKAFSISVNARNKKVAESVQSKISSAVSQIGYKVVTMSNSALSVEVRSGVPGKIEGMAGTIYNLTLDATVELKDNKTNAVVGSAVFSAKGAGKSEDEAMEKAAAGLKIDQSVLSELLQK